MDKTASGVFLNFVQRHCGFMYTQARSMLWPVKAQWLSQQNYLQIENLVGQGDRYFLETNRRSFTAGRCHLSGVRNR